MNSTNETSEGAPVYYDGYPDAPGWYDVLVDGEPDRLRNWRCQISGKHHWLNIEGKYIDALHVVTWTGEGTIQP